ncbi:MAG TPA: hypothetical protein VEI97_11765 [bacterium]|nr:hypothetical protein [bacterium]
MVKKGLNKHPGGKKKPVNMDQTEVKKAIQTECGVVVASIDKASRTVYVNKAQDLSKVEMTLGKVVGGWNVKLG